MWWHIKVGLTLILGGSIGASAAMANCAKRDVVVAQLKSDYNERFTAGGLQSSASSATLVEVWVSEKTGTFTVMLTSANGVTCVVAAGTDWHQNRAPETADGTES